MKRKADGQLDLLSLDSTQAAPVPSPQATPLPCATPNIFVRKRDGNTVPFDKGRIVLAIESAFKAVRNISADEPMTSELAQTVHCLAEKVSKYLLESAVSATPLELERIQDSIENQLMCDGFLTEARRFILYREDRRKIREQKSEPVKPPPPPSIYVVRRDGRREPLDPERIRHRLKEAANGLEESCDIEALLAEVMQCIVEGTPTSQITNILVATAKGRRHQHPAYGTLATRLFLKELYSEAIPEFCPANEFEALHKSRFSYEIQDAIHTDQLAAYLVHYDLEFLSQHLRLERDELISCSGLQWLYNDCFACEDGHRVETPQYFWMRIAMALAMNEGENKEAMALEFYEILSTLRFIPSEPILRSAGRGKAALAEDDNLEFSTRVTAHINIAAHIQDGELDDLLLYGTVSSAVRAMDNAIEISKYHSAAAAQLAHEHRDIFLGTVGADLALAQAGLTVESPEALALLQRCTEAISYYAILASTALATERGEPENESESHWSNGGLPFDTLKLSHNDRTASKDWLEVRAAVRRHGLRHGHLLALTPAHVAESLIDDITPAAPFGTQLQRLTACRKWVDGPVWITLPTDLIGPDLQQACLLAQQLNIRPYTPPVRMTIIEGHPFTDTAAATKVLKAIEKSN